METVKINYKGLKLTVTGEYLKGNPAVRYAPDGSGHPGDGDTYEIEYIFWTNDSGDEVDLFEVFDSLNELYNLEKECIRLINE